jgi:hypothetical protein
VSTLTPGNTHAEPEGRRQGLVFLAGSGFGKSNGVRYCGSKMLQNVLLRHILVYRHRSYSLSTFGSTVRVRAGSPASNSQQRAIFKYKKPFEHPPLLFQDVYCIDVYSRLLEFWTVGSFDAIFSFKHPIRTSECM